MKRTLSKRETAQFCSQLKMLLSSGVPLLESLSIIKNIQKNKNYGQIIKRLSEGESLADSMREYFPSVAVSSIAGAERAGNLEGTLERLAKYYGEQAELGDKLKSSLVYPAFVIALCLLSLIVLFVFVLPGFRSLFNDLDAKLPPVTQMVINIGEVLPQALLFLSVSIVFLSAFRKTKRGAAVMDEMIIKTRFYSREQIIQSFRTLGSLLQGGVPIVEALRTTTEAINNQVFRKIMIKIKEAIENGEKLSQTISAYSIFPKEIVQMIAVGENSGKLAEMLLSVADFYEQEREVLIKRFTTLLEPALTLFVGVIVGVIALAMFLPMVNMISQLQ
ncbi:MAG: type II secretion system F family protein [Candidatus Margulisbacteria bacterium]|nr:type II secretion system F family protein [Candidatus Margulisiibacteriota bacterium]